jgi:hypothetical protein
MRVLARRIKHPRDVTVQGSHDADPREHRRQAPARSSSSNLVRAAMGRMGTGTLASLWIDFPTASTNEVFVLAADRRPPHGRDIGRI